MAKPLAIVLGTIFGTVLAVNIASAVSPSIREAISGLPLGDQVTFIAGELDKIKQCGSDGEIAKMPEDIKSYEEAVSWYQGEIAGLKGNGVDTSRLEEGLVGMQAKLSELQTLYNLCQ